MTEMQISWMILIANVCCFVFIMWAHTSKRVRKSTVSYVMAYLFMLQGVLMAALRSLVAVPVVWFAIRAFIDARRQEREETEDGSVPGSCGDGSGQG